MIVMTGPIRSTGRPVGLAPAQPALDRLGRRDRLGDAEADRAVDAHAAVRRLLHHPDADRCRRELHDDVRREAVEVDALLEHPVGRAPERRVGLHREPALPAAVALECRQQQRRRRAATSPRRSPTRGRPRSTPGSRRRDRGWPLCQVGRIALPDVADDRRIGRRADRAEGDRVLRARRPPHESFHMSVAVSATLRESGPRTWTAMTSLTAGPDPDARRPVTAR